MVVPVPGVVVVEDLRRAPGVKQVVHLVLLPPRQRLAQDLPRLVHVEVPRPQEAQDVLVLGDLGVKGKRRMCGEGGGGIPVCVCALCVCSVWTVCV